MKAMVIRDSVYGNTAQIAQAIGIGLSGEPERAEDWARHILTRK